MDKYIIANFGEIFLKGDNINFFEDKLFKNFVFKLGELKNKIVFEKKRGGSFYLKLNKGVSDEEKNKIKEIIEKTPGFDSYYEALAVKTNLDEIKKAACQISDDFVKNRDIKTFAIKAEKIEKISFLKSQEVNIEVGSEVWKYLNNFKNKKVKVDLSNPDLRIWIKMRVKKTFIFFEKKKAVGGLPIGTAGKAIVLLSGGIDSPVASFLAMKRGLEVIAVHFHSMPKTGPESVEKVKKLVKKLSEFQGRIKLYLIPIVPVQKNIVQVAERKLSIVLQRRAFLKLAFQIAEKEGVKNKVIVTGDSLGQVASQTVENLIAVSEAMEGKRVFLMRPLISHDKKEIIDIAEKIGSLKISKEPHEDACSLFVPKNPETKANVFFVKKEEEKLDDSILEQVLRECEVFEFKS